MKFVAIALLIIGFAVLGWMIGGSGIKILIGVFCGSFIAWGIFLMKEEILACIRRQRE